MTKAAELWGNDWGSKNIYEEYQWEKMSIGDRFKAIESNRIKAHRMVESFVNALSHEKYRVDFQIDGTASTNFESKQILITSSPIMDTSLSVTDAATIMSGMACHEISHTRYGVETARAVATKWTGNSNAHALGNLLDDIRIERHFTRDYPGFADIFPPMMDYISGANKNTPPCNPLDCAIRATRFPNVTKWDGIESQRDWWKDWGVRWSQTDSTISDHINGVAEGLEHIKKMFQQEQEANQQQPGDEKPEPGESGKPEPGESGKPEPGKSGKPEPGKSGKPEPGTTEGQSTAEPPQYSTFLPSCPNDHPVDNSARASAQHLVERERHPHETDEHGNLVKIVPPSLTGRRVPIPGSVTAAVRGAFIRSRGGHFSISGAKKRGTLDRRSLHKVSMGDAAIFERRTDPSPARYNIYFLLDTSGSMIGQPIEQSVGVTMAICEALSFVPTVTATVFTWSDTGLAQVCEVWRTGQPVTNINRVVVCGGTPDSIIMGWAGKRILRDTAADVKPVIIMLSDGIGHPDMLAEAVRSLQRRGVGVYSVALKHNVDEDFQRDTYGHNNYVTAPVGDDVKLIASPLARLIAEITKSK